MVSSLTIRKQNFVAINLLGEWGYMQKIMAIKSESLLQKLWCIKMGREERVFKLSSLSHLLLLFAKRFSIIQRLSIYNYDFATLTRA